ncbi:ANTAR domain-containing response regulator [Aurantimonas coralicida]|uniref:ANTAR domain-containing response regulator n=1 Tax=Aurantimonas coralicida TaxID=182270 RepID=UPI001E518513|nr:ANTAR domain-containing protein [Aurantimonas coralicida]
MPALKTLRGLSVLIVHQPDEAGQMLMEHIKRIGCRAEAQWPIPKSIPDAFDALFLSIDHEHRSDLSRLAKTMDGIPPTIVAIVDYEDPSTLEMLFEVGALAAMERPIRPFGVLTNLLLARGLWIERIEDRKRLNKIQRKLSGMQRIQKAKSILMTIQSISEDDAYQSIRQQAMSKRVPMDEIATSIINANELLHSSQKGV